jgi:hypothetical protein
MDIAVETPLQRQNHFEISPGAVGPVGTTQILLEGRSSAPEIPKQRLYYPEDGSNIVDGFNPDQYYAGNTGDTVDYGWGINTPNTLVLKTVFQDLKAEDRATMPIQGGWQPEYGWREKAAQVYNAATTGQSFLPLPGGYELKAGQIPRGGNVPQKGPEGDLVGARNKGNQAILGDKLNIEDFQFYSRPIVTAGGQPTATSATQPVPPKII